MSDESTRNASDPSGDDVGEMIRRPRLDDRTADALFSGRLPADREDLADVAAFADRVRMVASETSTPVPNPALAAVLADGLSTEGDLPATVGSDASAPAVQASRLPNRRRTKRMLELLVAKVAGISLLAKTGVAAAAIVAGTTGAGLTGNLPDQAQGAFDRAFGEAPAEETEDADLVSRDVDELDVVDEPGAEAPEDTEDTATEEGSRPEVPGAEGRATADENAGEHGAEGRATADEAATDGREFGERKAAEAQENAPADGQQTGQDAASSGRQTGDDAATSGRERAETAPSGDEAAEPPVAPEQGQPEETPAGSSETGAEASTSAKDDAPGGGRP